ncbi:ABC transporter substrate-binding protein [Aquabacterium sp. OR-4]|uniref:ABC transporter substrate-binding protein n=1 Tax=Aquabacterium sp. OR-4 TaxID=2978127 RepID=UPI0021B1E952|nr:ABC transporter substrate-binding protein [Aquabacterium sp. OR-4]MDT7834826.1 ABC transporter substrate-binding protein [Aquabacterium sp. OR-4]
MARFFSRRLALGTAVAATLATALPVQAQTPVKFQLDWRFEGPSAFFLHPVAKGLFAAEKLNVTVDAGNGSANAVNRVASGTYDMGFADLAALMEFHANNPAAPNKPVAVMMVYNNTPAAVLSLKKTGLKGPADLTGKKLGAPVFDAGRRAFPVFAKANGVGAVNWISMEPALRETMLARGDVDAITGFSFTSLLSLEARGVKAEDVAVMAYPQFGVKLYGNAIIVGEDYLKKNPEAVKAFLRAFAKGAKAVIADPKAAVALVKERDGIANAELEERRLRMAIESSIATADARAEGFGDVKPPRLALMASQVADAYATKGRINPDAVWNGSYLPPAAERDIFAAAKPAKK